MTDLPARGREVLGTLRFRVTALATLAVLVVLSAVSVAVVLASRSTLTDNLDEALALQADSLTLQLNNGVDMPRASDDDFFFQLVAADGTVAVSSAAQAGEPEWRVGTLGEGVVVTADLPGGVGAARVLSRPVVDGTIHVAADLDDVEESTTALARPLAVSVPLSALALAAVVWWSVGRSLRPVEHIRAEVDRISGQHLERRVPEPGTHDEIARLAHTMNAMLDRLHDSSERQRRFVGDASHELRSPLTRMRSELEVDLAHPATADSAATHRSVLAEVATLQRLVDDLLLLARGDAGVLAAARSEPVDLDHVVDELVGPLGAQGGVQVDRSAVLPVQVRGDRAQLRRAVGNLLDNALRHSRTGISVSLSQADGDHAVLTVADDGPGVPVDQRDKIFERFTRLDEARHGSDGGAGLGLAIARDIAERHGGSLTLDPAADYGKGARFVLRLPTTS